MVRRESIFSEEELKHFYDREKNISNRLKKLTEDEINFINNYYVENLYIKMTGI